MTTWVCVLLKAFSCELFVKQNRITELTAHCIVCVFFPHEPIFLVVSHFFLITVFIKKDITFLLIFFNYG